MMGIASFCNKNTGTDTPTFQEPAEETWIQIQGATTEAVCGCVAGKVRRVSLVVTGSGFRNNDD